MSLLGYNYGSISSTYMTPPVVGSPPPLTLQMIPFILRLTQNIIVDGVAIWTITLATSIFSLLAVTLSTNMNFPNSDTNFEKHTSFHAFSGIPKHWTHANLFPEYSSSFHL
ncbi:hypothetical protein AAZX31_13G064600 [Glycine max]